MPQTSFRRHLQATNRGLAPASEKTVLDASVTRRQACHLGEEPGAISKKQRETVACIIAFRKMLQALRHWTQVQAVCHQPREGW